VVPVREDGPVALHHLVERPRHASRPFIARPRATTSGASTTRWMWFPCTENSISRYPNRWQPRANARWRARKHRCVRRFHTSRRRGSVTCSAPLRNFSRGRCGTFRRADWRFRPAPRLAPPHRRNGRSCCFGFLGRAYRGGSDTRRRSHGRGDAQVPPAHLRPDPAGEAESDVRSIKLNERTSLSAAAPGLNGSGTTGTRRKFEPGAEFD
jgi:hypothetical protein